MIDTDLNGVKAMTKLIAESTTPSDTGCFGIAIHPFVDNLIWFQRLSTGKYTQEQCNLLDENVYKDWLKEFCTHIDRCDTLMRVYMYWRDPWKLTFMKYCGEYLNEKDYATFLADAWVTEENPNMDVNVSRKESIDMFRKCRKRYLMTSEDLQYFKSLPTSITVYRGVAEGRIPLGLSWTDSLEKADWFSNRFNTKEKQGYILTADIGRENVIAYFNTRGEQELLVDVYAIKNNIKELK